MKNIIVRLLEIGIINLKNVKNGKINFLNSNIKETLTLQIGDILGVYGQNGSGKTTVIEALSILKSILVGMPLDDDLKNLITYGEKNIELLFKFYIEIKDKKYIDEVYRKFDPFLSYNNRVKVKFTEKGLELYEKVLTNRPKVLTKDENIYTFECDNKLAIVYFAQFFSLIEILEPQNLREKLKNELESTLKIYKDKEEKNV